MRARRVVEWAVSKVADRRQHWRGDDREALHALAAARADIPPPPVQSTDEMEVMRVDVRLRSLTGPRIHHGSGRRRGRQPADRGVRHAEGPGDVS